MNFNCQAAGEYQLDMRLPEKTIFSISNIRLRRRALIYNSKIKYRLIWRGHGGVI